MGNSETEPLANREEREIIVRGEAQSEVQNSISLLSRKKRRFGL